KNLESTELGGRQRGGIAGDPAIESCWRRNERALVDGQGPGDVARGDLRVVGERLGKVALVALVPREAVHSVVECSAHLVGMLDWKPHLLLETGGAAVPEQQRAERHVPKRGCVPHQPLAGDTLAARLAVREGQLGIVAGSTCDRAGRRQLLVLE